MVPLLHLAEAYWRDNDGFRDLLVQLMQMEQVRKIIMVMMMREVFLRLQRMVKLLWQLPVRNKVTLELKGAYNSLDYYEGYAGLTTADFNNDPFKGMCQSVRQYELRSETYYAKIHAEITDDIKNTTTFYYNQFYRDW